MDLVIKSKDGLTTVFLNGVEISNSVTNIEFKHNANEGLPELKLSFYLIDMLKAEGV
ncbi:hypothetical protein [Lacrimispora sp.]|uniref:hypothetical protein n=1 Tax=Lacrimispora sp. TaxID=2719234 RepID=UPI0028AE5562|nr:hypothetical protein [Lacrimispora sp.]